MSELTNIEAELNKLLSENAHLVESYTALGNAKKYLEKNDLEKAFGCIRIDMDKFRYAFPEVASLYERFKEL